MAILHAWPTRAAPVSTGYGRAPVDCHHEGPGDIAAGGTGQPGVKEGEEVGVSLLLDGKVQLTPVSAGHDLRSVRGLFCCCVAAGSDGRPCGTSKDAVESGRQ